MNKIITEFDKIGVATHEVTNLEETKEIVKELFTQLAHNSAGNCLTSNQIGINNCRIIVTNINTPAFFVNPIIVSKSEKLVDYVDACLSFPNKLATTKRHVSIEIKCDNYPDTVVFGSNNDPISFLQSVTLQKGLDMLNNISIFDIQEKYTIPTKDENNKKIHRNQKITIINEQTQEQKLIKYKQLDYYLSKGWLHLN